MANSSSSSIMESLFQRTLDDVINSLRLQLVGESAVVSKSMEEIRKEIKSTDLDTKSTALQKLAYFSSLHGIDMSWAAFHVVEVIGSPRFVHKKIGYLAASQSFNESTDVMLLITNQLRKDITSSNEYEVSLALECLSRIATVDLARDLSPEIFILLSSSKSYVRKKATGVVLRVFNMYPDAVRVCFKRLVENLETFDSQTVSATIGVFCELAAKDPVLYLPLAPEFYRVLVDSKNNWVLIKVLKIFARLAPLEHRLAKRVVDPICELMIKTGAKSLMFECVRTIVTSLSDFESAVKLAVGKIQELLLDDDPNLKYLGLQALSIVAPKHSWAVLDSKEVVIKSLSDQDPNIKLASLRLVMALVSEDNLIEICRVLVNYALKSEPEFCNEILGSVLSTCCRNYYEIVIDFDWYASLLGEISRIPHCQVGEEIENQFIDISMRVKDARPKVVHVSRDLLIDPALLGNPFIHGILCASAWVSGENVEFSKNPFELVEALLQPRTNLLPPSIRAVYIQSCFKVLIFCLHSYLFPKEIVSSSSSYGDLKEASGGDLTAHEAPNTYSQDEAFNPRVPDQVHEAISVPNGNNRVRSSVSSKTRFTHESIVSLLNLFEMSLRPLSGIHEVELHDRVRNVLGFIELVKPELIGNSANGGDDFVSKESSATEIVKLMHDVLFNELGPVSVTARERVPIPDEVSLKSDLSDLDLVCGDIQLPSSSSFSLANIHSKDKVGASISDHQSKEHSESSNESTSLLTEHRKRHGLYYLPSEKNEAMSTDYPPANNPKANDDPDLDDDAKDLVKLTGSSFVGKKKSSRSKPRPVVVKLDEVNIVPAAAAAQIPKPDDSTLSGAVRDVLYSNEVTPDTFTDRWRGKEKVNTEHPVESIENSRTRKHKHHSHSKEKTSRSSRNNNGEEKVEKAKHKSSQRHGRQKTRERSDVIPSSVPAQAAVIPDFLL